MTVTLPQHLALHFLVQSAFPFGEGKWVELRTEWFNAFNHPTFGTPGRVMNYPNFGVVTSTALSERNIQFGLKIVF